MTGAGQGQVIDNWRERELHCKWFGHSLSGVLRREPVLLDVPPILASPDDQPRGVAHNEVRRCERCLLEFRFPKNYTPEHGDATKRDAALSPASGGV